MAIVKLLGAVWEDTQSSVFSRIYGTVTGTPIQQSQVNNITLKVFDLIASKTNPVYTDAAVVIATAISNTLITNNPNWEMDNIGYNFAWVIPAAAFPNPTKSCRIEFTITETDGNIIRIVSDVSVQEVFS